MKASKTAQVIKYMVDRLNGDLLKTQILKFLYLVDLEWVRYTGRQFTDLNWIWYLHGPWDRHFEEILADMCGKELECRTQPRFQGGHFSLFYPGSRPRFDADLDLAEQAVVDRILDAFRQKSVRELLEEYVYQTAPMLAAERRGERLNLGLVAGEYERDYDELSREFADFDVDWADSPN